MLPLSAARACPGVLLASTWDRQSPDWRLCLGRGTVRRDGCPAHVLGCLRPTRPDPRAPRKDVAQVFTCGFCLLTCGQYVAVQLPVPIASRSFFELVRREG